MKQAFSPGSSSTAYVYKFLPVLFNTPHCCEKVYRQYQISVTFIFDIKVAIYRSPRNW